jgi:hypothetical protein
MKYRILMFFIKELFEILEPDMLKEVVDNVLDPVEEKYKDNPAIIMICNKIRETWDIPEFDD